MAIRKIIEAAFLMVAAALAGCDNPLVDGGPLSPGESLVRITITDSQATRAVRPIGNSNAANNVDHVQLVVYAMNASGGWDEASDVEFAAENGLDIPNGLLAWHSSGDDGHNWDDSHDETQIVLLRNLVPETEYRIVGYGYNGENEPFTKSEDNGSFRTTSFAEVQEIFAGSIKSATNAAGAFDQAQPLILERQVAGMLARFRNIPAVWNSRDVAKVVVKTSVKAANITFPHNGDSGIFNGVDMLSPADVNDPAFPLLTFNVAEISTGRKKLDESNETSKLVYTFNTVTEGKVNGDKKPFAAEYTTVYPGLELDGLEIFGACFILPYDKHYNKQTLWIELLDADGAVLQKRNVNVKSGQEPTGGSTSRYDIRRNHFYSIDNIDLSEANNVTVIVDDRWDGVHELIPSET